MTTSPASVHEWSARPPRQRLRSRLLGDGNGPNRGHLAVLRLTRVCAPVDAPHMSRSRRLRSNQGGCENARREGDFNAHAAWRPGTAEKKCQTLRRLGSIPAQQMAPATYSAAVR